MINKTRFFGYVLADKLDPDLAHIFITDNPNNVLTDVILLSVALKSDYFFWAELEFMTLLSNLNNLLKGHKIVWNS